jgi:hypothetical protein
VTLTSDQLPMFDPPILQATPNAISSPASADGPSPCVSPDGQTADLFGPVPAPANPSQPPVRARQAMTSATCGLRGFLSSASAALQQSLENRLRRQLDGAGSTLFSLTWNRKGTPAGRPYFQLAASARRISDSDCGSWPSPCANQANGEPEAFLERKRRSVARGSSMGISLTDLQMVAKTASWPTPTRQDAASSGAAGYSTESGRHSGTTLTDAARAAWPTPMAGTPAQKGYNEAGNNGSSRKTVALASWPTARATDGEKNVRTTEGAAREMERKGSPQDLNQAATLASWATPAARDYKSESATDEFNAKRWDHPRGKPLSAEATLVSGPTSNGSPAPTAKPGQLDPDFSRWLMGYSAEHLSCAPTETRSRRSARPSS